KKAEEAKKAEEQRKKEEEEKKGYDTGITYDQLARTPDDYKYKKVKFEGKVIQVIEDGDEVQIRLAVSGNYDKVVLCSYKKSITPSRVLEDDYITIRGISAGTITYESTMGGNITIPGIAVEKIN
ncbi:glycosylating toxin anti-sigma factor TcdC, partial [Clostridioides difficile]|nr:glycosylating toxin anti-sigma factor TcdC [Clostridioides difficile]MCE0597255.1 glycosylating toxin anti-sigma factor TcdC [Clostridioides difficile]MCE0655031.1 glycosylating toxin anti-sigma factor TcdC [Clostridioides difficile]